MTQSGRKVRIQYDSGTGPADIAGARTDTLTINNEPIDITDKDDAGIQTMLDDISVKSFSAAVTGVMKNNTLATLAASATEGAALHDFVVVVGDNPALMTLTGSWFINNFEITGEVQDAITFSCQISSSGTIVVT